jgi:hypothetical protein
VRIWEKVQPVKEVRFLQVDKDIKMIDNPFVKGIKFWESLGLNDTTPAETFNFTSVITNEIAG